ncbi:toxin-antitoxin system, toxin component family protein [Streptomyces sp. NPDC052109]|uniref:toxin-antitoxin system, toxin component family protein n=1 Tax=Streptomyces sp. NPDC052109 TaxID=3155527 RepID=UPI00344764FC
MGIAGALRRAARCAGRLRQRSRTDVTMRRLTAHFAAAVRDRPHPPADARELCRALCAAMSTLRGGRPVQLRFERFPDELAVTGLWVEFHDFDLVIVEERAEGVQQLVILGHELWHMHAGHCQHPGADAAASRVLAEEPDLCAAALAVAARDGSRERDEADADAFGHRLATAFRPHLLHGTGRPLDPLQRSLGHRGRAEGPR